MRATLDVTPELMPMLTGALPSNAKIVGSADSDGCVRLILEGESLNGHLIAVVTDSVTRRIVDLVPRRG